MSGSKRVLIIFLSEILVVSFALLYPHWWLRVRGARVTLDGQEVAGAKVFRSCYNRTIFIRLPAGEHPLYIVDQTYPGFVGPPSQGDDEFLNVSDLLGVLFTESEYPPMVLMGPGIKLGDHPALVLHTKWLEFTSLDDDKTRIRVSW
jgi:hypothetical protein